MATKVPNFISVLTAMPGWDQKFCTIFYKYLVVVSSGFGRAPKYGISEMFKYLRERQTGEWLQKYHWKKL